MSPRRRAPRSLAGAIEGVIAASAPKTLLADVQRAWPRACGEVMAREAEPISEQAGVVTISCRSAVWASELELMQSEILAKLIDELDGAQLSGLRFVVAGS